jgi:oligoribonuclease NrnB/cAMP/cGMP phosphodiesterase (DHH superfamily)
LSGKYLVITHTDIDGVGSASLYIYLQGSPPVGILFSEPYTLNNVLPRSLKYDVDRIAIMDLGMNPMVMDQIFSALEEITSRGIVVEWYDHHV